MKPQYLAMDLIFNLTKYLEIKNHKKHSDLHQDLSSFRFVLFMFHLYQQSIVFSIRQNEEKDLNTEAFSSKEHIQA